MLSECVEGIAAHRDWKVDYTEAFFDQLRDSLDTICPKKAPAPAKPATQPANPVVRQPMTSSADVEERKYYECQIDGYCECHNSAGTAALIVCDDGTQFWIPMASIRGQEPDPREKIETLRLPGWKILEDDLEHLLT